MKIQRMRKQCIPGPLLAGVGPGDEAGFVIDSVRDLTSRMSNRAISERAYSVTCERQKTYGDLPETTAFKSCRETRAKNQLLINRLTHDQLSPFDTQRSDRGYPTSVNNIHPCPKRWLLMPLACVEVRIATTMRTATRLERERPISAHVGWP